MCKIYFEKNFRAAWKKSTKKINVFTIRFLTCFQKFDGVPTFSFTVFGQTVVVSVDPVFIAIFNADLKIIKKKYYTTIYKIYIKRAYILCLCISYNISRTKIWNVLKIMSNRILKFIIFEKFSVLIRLFHFVVNLVILYFPCFYVM